MRIAIVGWEEGLAGQVSTWIETAMQCSIEYYVHPNDTFPMISANDALARPAKNFSFPVNGMYLNLPMIISKDWLKRLAELNIEGVVCCLSNSQERESIYRELVKSDIALLTAVHPSAQVLGGAEIKPGIDTVLEILDFEKQALNADLIITAEGRIDSQTANNKAPAGVAKVAKKLGIPCVGIAGSIGDNIENLHTIGMTSLFSIIPGPCSLAEAIHKGKENIIKTTEQLIRLILKFNN